MHVSKKTKIQESINKIRNATATGAVGYEDKQSDEGTRNSNARNRYKRGSRNVRQVNSNISRLNNTPGRSKIRTAASGRSSQRSSERAGVPSVGSHISNLIENRPSETGVVQRIDYDEAMPMLEPTVSHYGKTGEGMCVRGSEYLTDIKCIPTTVPSGNTASSQGEVLYTIPINPLFWLGSRVKKFYEMYRKYKIKDLVFELIPAVASTTAGALLGVCTYDPDDNPTMIQDLDSRMRVFMAMKGAKIWNVYSIGRVGFTDDGTFDWYFTGDSQDSKLSIQGCFYMVCASEITPTIEAEEYTLGQLVVHYDICFEDRILDMSEESAYSGVIQVTQNTDISNYLDTLTPNGVVFMPVAIVSPIVPTELEYVYIIYFEQAFNYGYNVARQWVVVDTEQGESRNYGQQGSIWYGYSNSTGALIIANNLADAMARHPGTLLQSAVAANAKMYGGRIKIYAFPTVYD